MKLVLTALGAGGALGIVVFGASCGSRGPLDDAPLVEASARQNRCLAIAFCSSVSPGP